MPNTQMVKTNKDPYKICKPCFKTSKQKGKEANRNEDEAESRASSVASFIGSIES